MSVPFNSYFHFVPGGPILPMELLRQIGESVNTDDIVCIGGCGFGREVHALMELLKLLNKLPKLYAFDTFGETFASEHFEGLPETTPWGEQFSVWAARVGGPGRLIDHFAFYLRNSPAREYLTDWAQFPHWTVAEEFKDSSVSFVLANGSHRPENVKQEIGKWWPKMKAGGKIGIYGHDADDFRVKLTVAREFFSTNGAINLDVGQNHVIIER